MKRVRRATLQLGLSIRRIDARLSNDDLENMRLRFDRLHAIMPSGQEVLYPQDAELPAMDIKQAFESRGRFVVYLGYRSGSARAQL
jgi:hypothetical protein